MAPLIYKITLNAKIVPTLKDIYSALKDPSSTNRIKGVLFIALSRGHDLAKRGNSSSFHCPRCMEPNETQIYIFWYCHCVKLIIHKRETYSIQVSSQEDLRVWIENNVRFSTLALSDAHPPIQFVFGIMLWFHKYSLGVWKGILAFEQ